MRAVDRMIDMNVTDLVPNDILEAPEKTTRSMMNDTEYVLRILF